MFEANGTKMEILMQMIQEFEITTKEAKMIFEYIESCPDILDREEIFTSESTITNPKDTSMNLLLSDSGYYLNIKRITIVLLATFLDYYLTNGVMGAGLALFGVQLQAIMKLKEEKLCIVKEMLLDPKKLYNALDLSYYGLECVNNDIECHFNSNGVCTLPKKEVDATLIDLSDKGIAKKTDNKYKINVL